MSEQQPASSSYPQPIGQANEPAPIPPPMPAPMSPSGVPMGANSVAPRKQGAWGLWWLCLITFSIYYLIWYDRINSELGRVLNEPLPANGNWCVDDQRFSRSAINRIRGDLTR